MITVYRYDPYILRVRSVHVENVCSQKLAENAQTNHDVIMIDCCPRQHVPPQLCVPMYDRLEYMHLVLVMRWAVQPVKFVGLAIHCAARVAS